MSSILNTTRCHFKVTTLSQLILQAKPEDVIHCPNILNYILPPKTQWRWLTYNLASWINLAFTLFRGSWKYNSMTPCHRCNYCVGGNCNKGHDPQIFDGVGKLVELPSGMYRIFKLEIVSLMISGDPWFGLVEFWISNVCCCFPQAGALEKIKSKQILKIQNSTYPNQWAADKVNIRRFL